MIGFLLVGEQSHDRPEALYRVDTHVVCQQRIESGTAVARFQVL
jgi:hypothetical protein